VPPLTAAQIAPLARQIPDWKVIEHHHLQRDRNACGSNTSRDVPSDQGRRRSQAMRRRAIPPRAVGVQGLCPRRRATT
jgi:hypothetical protein